MSNVPKTNSRNDTEREAVFEVRDETYQVQLAAGRDLNLYLRRVRIVFGVPARRPNRMKLLPSTAK